MILSIASGKGGTGKTTIAVNLARVLGRKARLLDCDVEEPNAQLFINAVLGNPVPVTTPVPAVDEDACTMCGECGDLCRFKAIVIVGTSLLTFPELCHSCGGCWEVCSVGAVSQAQRELGVIEEGTSGELEFAHGRLRVGEAMAPPLVRAVRERMGTREVTIIDAPPGTSCPVIAAMRDTDFVLLVTEPTPFGLHDLCMAMDLAAELEVPAAVIINRSGPTDALIEDECRARGIPVLLKIPFERRIAEAYSRGEPLSEAFPEYSEKLRQVWHQVREEVRS